MKNDSLGDRMKEYEDVTRHYLTRRIPTILRLDGKAFHKFTIPFNKPFDDNLRHAMVHTAKTILHNIDGAKMAYLQSDECSIIITDYTSINTDAWFAYNIQKMVSISASEFSVMFNYIIESISPNITNMSAFFDARVFNIPESEILNYLIWRQSDWKRNSIQMLARKYYSQKELHGKKTAELHDMIHDMGDNWANLDSPWKNGTFLYYKKDIENADGRILMQNYPIFLDDDGKKLINELINNFSNSDDNI